MPTLAPRKVGLASRVSPEQAYHGQSLGLKGGWPAQNAILKQYALPAAAHPDAPGLDWLRVVDCL
jgi:hypothetical protein